MGNATVCSFWRKAVDGKAEATEPLEILLMAFESITYISFPHVSYVAEL
jgi:hypothetical protein